MGEVFQATLDPICGSLWISALVACVALLLFFVCMTAFKLKAYVAALISLGVAIIVAVFAYKMPIVYALLSASEGAVAGIIPVCITIIAALWFYRVTELSGRSEDLKKIFDFLGGGDIRLQTILIAYCFGALIEALAGFGSPIAIAGAMLLTIGVPPLKTAVIVLIADTVPVAYGSLGVPITTIGKTVPGAIGAEATSEYVAAICGHIVPLFSSVIPLLILLILDGKKGLKDCWVPALVIGISLGITQWFVSNYMAYEITDVVGSLVSLLVSVVFLRFWKLRGVEESRKRFGLGPYVKPKKGTLTPSRVWMSIMPYIVVIFILTLAKCGLPLSATDINIPWPGLTTVDESGAVTSLVLDHNGANPGTVYSLGWLSNCGTLMLIAAIIVTIALHIFDEKGKYSITLKGSFSLLGKTISETWEATFTIVIVMAFAYVMNFSGQTNSMGHALASTGELFAFLSPIIGWIGTAITGSDNSSNALFGALQAEAAQSDPIFQNVSYILFLASNTLGGVIGKMISPQSLVIAAATVSVATSKIFKKVLPWTIGLLLVVCIIIFLLADTLAFMHPPIT